MQIILTVHFSASFHEVFLPGVDNRRFDAVIPAQIAGTPNEIILPLEVWNGEWFISGGKNVKLSVQKQDIERIPLSADLVLDAVFKPQHLSFTIVVSENYPGYTTFNKYALNGPVTIGKRTNDHIQFSHRFVSETKGEHASIQMVGGCWVAVDNDSTNGTYLCGRRLKGSVPLTYGDTLYIFGLKIVFMDDFIAVNNPHEGIKVTGLYPYSPVHVSANNEAEPEDVYYIRSPRKIEPLDTAPVEIEAPPAPQQSGRQPLFFTIGPAFTMIIPMAAGVIFTLWSTQNAGGATSPFMFMGIITSVTAALIGVFWALMNNNYNKKKEKDAEQTRLDLYKKYLHRMEQIVINKYSHNKVMLERLYPPVAECMGWAASLNSRLWERSFLHQDFLSVRLGIGTLPSPSEIIIPKEKFTLIDDSLANEPARIKREYLSLQKSPVSISLSKNPNIGVVSVKNGGLAGIARTLTLGLTANHSYTEVKAVYIYDSAKQADWEVYKWLPHTWDSGVRMVAGDKVAAGEVLFHLTNILRSRLEDDERHNDPKHVLPHYVVFIADMSLIENEPVLKYLSEPTVQMGVTVVMFCKSVDMLPNNCTAIIRDDDSYSGCYSLDGSFPDTDEIAFDQIDAYSMERYARTLSGIKVRELASAGGIPQMLTFLDMYKTSRLETLDIYKRWLENRTFESMRAMIGQYGGGEPIYLDIHEKYHGPHGLVAGTTGSGKSETLQTYILSLAMNYHPHEVSFILIDYKGGGMAESFKDLPHLSGIITNLSGSQTTRALTSINSEIKRRQAMFNRANVKHIDDYIELFRAESVTEPMPHLIIIADEFAELKKEQGDFVRELVSASRVGRSLGVHLILATQKPSGVVDDEIWGNSRFRICLRVQDKQDSTEMLKRPDAAFITNPGRGFFQVGNDELFEEFQSGWSGADYEPEHPFTDSEKENISMINLWGKPISLLSRKSKNISDFSEKRISQLAAAVEFLAQVAVDNNIQTCNRIWLPPLPKALYLDEVPDVTSAAPGLLFSIGLADDPTNQQQAAVAFDLLTTGHILISGSVGSGKTTLVQTILYALSTRHSPSKVNIYIADFGSRTLGVFANLPHVGGVVYDNEPDKTDKLITLLLNELDMRKQRLSSQGMGSYREYVQINDDLPAVVFVIDNYAGFMENCGHHEDSLTVLSREAASYGIYLLIATTGDIRTRIRQNISTAIGLQLADKFEYGEIVGERTELLPEENIPGRGLIKYPNPLEFQAAVCMRPVEGQTLNEQLRKQFETISHEWKGFPAKPIPQVPNDMSYRAFSNYTVVDAVRRNDQLAIGYDLNTAEPLAISPSSMYCYTVSGQERSGKTNFLKVLLSESLRKTGDIILIDTSGAFSLFSGDPRITLLQNQDELYAYMSERLVPAFRERNIAKNSGQSKEAFSQISIFIDSLGAFCDMVYNSERDMKGFLEQALLKGAGHRIIWYGAVTPEDYSNHSAKGFMRSFTGYREGIHFGGMIDNQRIFSFDLPYADRGKRMQPGVGLIEKNGVTCKILTPLM